MRPPLGEIQHHGVRRALELITQVHAPNGNPQGGATLGDLEREPVGVKVLMIEWMHHSSLRGAAG